MRLPPRSIRRRYRGTVVVAKGQERAKESGKAKEKVKIDRAVGAVGVKDKEMVVADLGHHPR